MTQAWGGVVRASLCLALLLLLLLLAFKRNGQRRAGRPPTCGERQGNKSCRGTERNAFVVLDAELLRKWCGGGTSAARRWRKPRAAAVPAG